MAGARQNASRRSQFESLSAVCERFNAELIKSGDPQAVALGRSMADALAKISLELKDTKTKITRSAVAVGLKQGLRETPSILANFPKQVREQLTLAFRTILQEEMPDFLSGERDKLARIIERGRLRNEDEFYLVRVDEIEGQSALRGELAVLLKLVDAFEAGGR